MLRMKAGLGLVVSAGLLGSAGIVGCSADGTSDDYIPSVEMDASGTVPPPSLGGGDDPEPIRTDRDAMTPRDAGRDARPDASRRDSGSDASRDAAVEAEAGPPAPEPGTICASAGAVVARDCGFCGAQETVCDANAGGELAWSDYGPCSNEVPAAEDRCMPGTAQDNECGLCGKSSDVCQRDCHWGKGTCRESAGACVPDSIRYITAGCGAVTDKFRKQTCNDTCAFGAASPLPCVAKEDFVSITRAKSFSVTIEGKMGGEINKLTGGSAATACAPVAGAPDGGGPLPANMMPYTYLEIRNPHAKDATVEVEFAPDLPAGTWMYTFAAVYPNAIPRDDAARTACRKFNSYCSTGGGSWSCFKGVDAFTIPANSKVFVYVQPTSRPGATIPLPIKYTATVTTLKLD